MNYSMITRITILQSGTTSVPHWGQSHMSQMVPHAGLTNRNYTSGINPTLSPACIWDRTTPSIEGCESHIESRLRSLRLGEALKGEGKTYIVGQKNSNCVHPLCQRKTQPSKAARNCSSEKGSFGDQAGRLRGGENRTEMGSKRGFKSENLSFESCKHTKTNETFRYGLLTPYKGTIPGGGESTPIEAANRLHSMPSILADGSPNLKCIAHVLGERQETHNA